MSNSNTFVIALVVCLPVALAIIALGFIAIKTKLETGSFYIKRDKD